MSTLVSIALPVFNSEKTLDQAIVSVLMQSYPHWELILLDDGSTDKSLEIAKKFNDPRIRIFSDGVNKGLPARLNEAIDRSGGQYFARMDQDDICFPDRLKLQVKFLEQHPQMDLVGSRALLFNNALDFCGLFPFRQSHKQICNHPWRGFYLAHPTWMGRIEWFKKYRYHNIDRAEDQDLLLRSYQQSRFECLPEVLLAYRVRDRISIKISSRARKSLLGAQVRIFAQEGNWLNFFLSLTNYFAKTAIDIISAILGSIKKQGLQAEMLPFKMQWEQLKSRVTDVSANGR